MLKNVFYLKKKKKKKKPVNTGLMASNGLIYMFLT